MLNLARKFVLLSMTGTFLAGGSNLSSASNVSTAAGEAHANGSTGQHEPTGASRPTPFSCPAEVLAILAKAFNQASITDATVLDGQEPSTGSVPDQSNPILGD
jgi:hypothetical protein